MKIKPGWIVVPGVFAVGLGLMFLFLSMREEPARRTPEPRPRSVASEVVYRSTIESRIAAFGRLASAQPVDLIAEVPGELTPGDVPFRPGQEFRRGQTLVVIDPRQARLDLNTAKADLLTALAQVLPEIKVDFPDEYQVWQDYFNRTEFDQPLDPLPEAANQRIKLFLARFNVFKLYFTVRNLEIRLNKHYIEAPFDGAITGASLRVGSNAGVNTRLGSIINLEDLEVEIPVPTEELRWISVNESVTLTSTEVKGLFSGEITRIGQALDSGTETVPVFISVDPDPDNRLYEGLFLEAAIPGAAVDSAFRLPRTALYDDRFVYVVDEGKLELRPVEIARREQATVIITDGLNDGDTVVIEQLQGVAPGMLANPRFPVMQQEDAVR